MTKKAIQIKCEGASTLPLDSLEPFQGEFKSLDRINAERLKREILMDGFSDPFNIWRDQDHFWILDGHQRRLVLLSLRKDGYEIPDLPVVWVEADSFEQAKRKVLAQASQYGEVDQAGLIEMMNSACLETSELIDTFRFPEIDFELLKEPPEDDSGKAAELIDKAEELREKWGVERGQVWEIPGKAGVHRVMCGDSTDGGDVALLMDGEKASRLLMDPPYGMRLDTDYTKMPDVNVKSRKYAPVIGDDADFDPRGVMELFSGCKEQFWWGADYYRKLIPDGGAWLVWDKRVEANDEAIGSAFELCWSLQPHRRRIYRQNWCGFTAHDAGETRDHPTQKPVKLFGKLIESFSNSGDIVVDMFLGSGTTVVASEQEGRVCHGMEIEPKYVAVTLERMLSLGLNPVLSND